MNEAITQFPTLTTTTEQTHFNVSLQLKYSTKTQNLLE